MIKNIIKQSFIWFIIVGTIAYATMIITGNTLPTFIQANQIQIGTYTKTIYTINIQTYLKQIEDNINIPIKDMFISAPNFPEITNISQLGGWLVNVLLFFINMLIWWLNTILLIPTKILIFQPIILIATILGIDLETFPGIKIIYLIYTGIKIEYIPYI